MKIRKLRTYLWKKIHYKSLEILEKYRKSEIPILLIRFILFTLQMKEEYKSLVEELNKLSEDFPATKDRMVEIAKILLAEHFNYYRKKP